MKFIIYSEYGELLDLAMRLQDDKHEVYMYIPPDDKVHYERIGDGIIEKVHTWVDCIGQGYIWVFDGCTNGRLQDWLRERGEVVFGGSEAADKLENDRQLGQRLFKAAGFHQVESHNFKSIDDAIKFVEEHKDQRWILKQNGNAPKHLSHMGKFPGNEDMLFHLNFLKKAWSVVQYGPVDFDLMEVVDGLELAASVFFNGKDFMKNKDGKVVGFLNFEEKKTHDGGLGETCGEMGTTFIGVTEDNKLFREIMMKPKIVEALRAAKFKGIFDINCIQGKDGIVALEATCRFGVPSTSYEFICAMPDPASVLQAVAKGEDKPIDIQMGVGMVMVVVAKPFPIETDVDEQSTSIGEKLWILKDGKPVEDFSKEQKQYIHLQNFLKDDEGYKVATKNGYLLTVTSHGKLIEDVRNDIIKRIKDNLYISGMVYRTDIGKRVEKAGGATPEQKLKKEYDTKIQELESKHKEELGKIKKVIKKTVYGT